jgi:phosphoglycerate dehydrogenase-like enzyme
MARILLTQIAYRRLQAELSALPGLACLTMDTDGRVRINDLDEASDKTAFDSAWVSSDFFTSGIAKHYFDGIERSTDLSWVQSAGAGTDHPIFGMIAGKGARLSTSHHQADGMAEYVLWGVLDHFQGGRLRAAEQAAHIWGRRQWREVGGTRWLIVGYGAIGQAVARRARAFDVHITGVRRRPGPAPFADAIVYPDVLRDQLGESDVVVLCAPRTAATENMVDATFLAAMKPGSVLVNVGRGVLVDEAALLAALDARKPAHAVLDVFRVEPLPADSPFWDHPRVTLTSHGSARSANNEARGDAVFLANLRRYLAGEQPLDQVNLADVLNA